MAVQQAINSISLEERDELFEKEEKVDRLNKPNGSDVYVFVGPCGSEDWHADGYRYVDMAVKAGRLPITRPIDTGQVM